jgi:hypothetical protein
VTFFRFDVRTNWNSTEEETAHIMGTTSVLEGMWESEVEKRRTGRPSRP